MHHDNCPYLVIWEATQAGVSVARDGRALAPKPAHPLELDTAEAREMIAQVARLQPDSFLVTGCDPLARTDLLGLIAYGTRLGLRVTLSSAATPRLAEADFQSLKNSGIHQLTLSLDHARTANGSDGTTVIAHKARGAGLSLQVHTTFSGQNLREFDALAARLEAIQPRRWSVFPALPGAVNGAEPLTAAESAALSERLAELAGRVSYEIKTAEGQVPWQTQLPQGSPGLNSAQRRPPSGVITGRGFLFISHVGGLRPSNFYPLTAANVRVCEVREVYARCAEFQKSRSARADEPAQDDQLEAPPREPRRLSRTASELAPA